MATSGAHGVEQKIYDVGNTCMLNLEFLGFGRPLSEDGVWVFAHAFYILQ